MLDIVHFPLFLASVLLLCITPGPDLAYVVGQSVARGRRSASVTSSGRRARRRSHRPKPVSCCCAALLPR
jgi:hypothetical protein